MTKVGALLTYPHFHCCRLLLNPPSETNGWGNVHLFTLFHSFFVVVIIGKGLSLRIASFWYGILWYSYINTETQPYLPTPNPTWHEIATSHMSCLHLNCHATILSSFRHKFYQAELIVDSQSSQETNLPIRIWVSDFTICKKIMFPITQTSNFAISFV